MVVPSPDAVRENVPAVLDVYVYAPLQAGVPPEGGLGIEGMNGPALQLRRLVAVAVRAVRAAGSVPMWALYATTAVASISRSDWAFSMHARAWAFAWSGIASAATRPMTDTTTMRSMSVSPTSVPRIPFLFRQRSNMRSPRYS